MKKVNGLKSTNGMKIIKVNKVKIADRFFTRFRGYMYQSAPKNIEVLIITPCDSIHTFGMRFNIDVLFLDDEDHVVHMNKNLGKRKMVMPIKDVVKVAEAKAGTFSSVEVGDLVIFSEEL